MKVPFELEWMGGAAEHHFRKARPGIDDLPWGTLDPSKYAPAAVDQARASWTEVAINEYRAVASFSEVLRALVDVKAPLDLLGMTSDFLADECSHVELASRMAMELGGAAPRDGRLRALHRAAARPDRDAARERARPARELHRRGVQRRDGERELRVDLARASARRLRDHPARRGAPPPPRRPLLRVGAVADRRRRAASPRPGDARPRCEASRRSGSRPRRGRRCPPRGPTTICRALGWLGPAQFAPVAKEVVVRDILDPLATIGIAITPEERAALLA